MLIYVVQIRTTSDDPRVDKAWRNHRVFSFTDGENPLDYDYIENIKKQVLDEMYNVCGDLSYMFMYRIGYLTSGGNVRWEYTECEDKSFETDNDEDD